MNSLFFNGNNIKFIYKKSNKMKFSKQFLAIFFHYRQNANMLLSVTFSKPAFDLKNVLGKPYKKIRIKKNPASTGLSFFAEMFTDTQVFHKTFSETELDNFISNHAGTSFKSCVERFTDKEIIILANKKGKITRLEKKLPNENNFEKSNSQNSSKYFSKPESSDKKNINRIKNYIIPEGKPVPFLISLGIMTPDGKIINSHYDKFKQINRFLEYINDILPNVLEQKKAENYPLQIADFGCGKSYLTFAVHYFLTKIKNLDCNILGLDLKQDVIEHCNKLALDLNCKNLIFKIGNICEYSNCENEHNPDIIITLHACDTATDYALKYATEKNAKAILCVPCCQHEINQQLEKNKQFLNTSNASVLFPLFKYGLIRERTAALITDALRAEFLEQKNYKVDVIEFIDMNHTPKNILLRAIKKQTPQKSSNPKLSSKPDLLDLLKISPTIFN